MDSVFDSKWKEEVEDSVSGYSSLSEEAGDAKEIEKREIAKCVRKLKNNKIGGRDGIVGELLKYGGSGMIDLLEQLFSVIWQSGYQRNLLNVGKPLIVTILTETLCSEVMVHLLTSFVRISAI